MPVSGKPFTVNGDLNVTDQVGLQTHTHTGVQTGGGTSGPPTPGS